MIFANDPSSTHPTTGIDNCKNIADIFFLKLSILTPIWCFSTV